MQALTGTIEPELDATIASAAGDEDAFRRIIAAYHAEMWHVGRTRSISLRRTATVGAPTPCRHPRPSIASA
jgi:hypothetical protein